MKAVILSGGRGTRLSPLTDKKPKPLISVGGIPIIEALLESLSKSGIDECAITLGYRKDDIKKALGSVCHGVKITYFEEDEPLGTAGAVKNCESFLDSDFIVLSGDSLCELELETALTSHRLSGDLATLVLTPSSDVLEYGVVLLDKSGKVAGFSEKPAWEGVKSDLVNCGIYIFKREILNLIPKNTFWDFSKNVFPQMLAENKSINTYISRSFWCDVGNPWALYSCNMKTLSEDFFLRYTPENVHRHKSAVIQRSVIGKGTTVHADCDIRHAVIGEDCDIGAGAEIAGCIIGDRVRLGEGVRVERGAVIGDDSYISQGRVVSEGKKLSADTRLEDDGAAASFSAGCVLWQGGSIVFDKKKPEDFFAMGRAATALSKSVATLYSLSQGAYLAATEFALGIAWSGGEGIIFGEGKKADAAFCAGSFDLPVFHFLESGDRIILTPFSKSSLPLSRSEERELSSAFERPSPGCGDGCVRYFDGWEILEKRHLLKLLGACSASHGKVKIKNNAVGRRFAQYAPQNMIYTAEKKDVGFFIEISSDRENVSLSWRRRRLDTEHVHALILKSLIAKGQKSFILPSSAPSAFDTIAENSGAKITRVSKASPSPAAFEDLWARDAFFAAALLYKVLEMHSFSEEKLEKTVDSLPVFLCIKKEVKTSGASAGFIMRSLEREKNYSSRPDGVHLALERGGVRITPEAQNRFKLFAEAQSAESAAELCSFAGELIQKISQSQNE